MRKKNAARTPGQVKDRQVNVNFTDAEDKALTKAADQFQMSKANLVRSIVLGKVRVKLVEHKCDTIATDGVSAGS